MKIKHVITTLALAGMLGAGAFAGIKASGVAREAKAATKADIYLDITATNWESKNEKIYVHYWGGTEETTWPGVELTKNDFGLYTTKVANDSTGLKFHVSEDWGGDCETGNLSFDSTKMLWTITKQASPCVASAAAYSEKTIYVLDKGGDRLQVNHYAHVWKDKSYGTTWPGVAMTQHSGHIYKLNIPSALDKVIFHNNEGNQTANLSIDGECSILESDWNGSHWAPVLAAQFVDTYMKFDSIPTTNVSQGTDCKNGWSELYAAYTTTYASVQGEIVKIKDVADRLAAWAKENGRTLDKDTGAMSSQSFTYSLSTRESGNNALIIIIVSSISIVALLGIGLMAKRRKEDR